MGTIKYSVKHSDGLLNHNMLTAIAMIIMIIDHTGLSLFTHNREVYYIMRCIGRLAFPIFAFLLVEGYKHTKNLRRYQLRLLIFALISEIPFNLMVSGKLFYTSSQNIGFTLVLGLILLETAERLRKKDMQLLNLVLCIIIFNLADYLHFDYGFRGMITIIVFYFYKDIKLQALWLLLAYLTSPSMTLFTLGSADTGFRVPIQVLAILALPIIHLYDGQKGKTLVEFVESKLEKKAGILTGQSKGLARDTKGNTIEAEVIEPNQSEKTFEQKLQDAATQAVTKYALNSWRGTKLRKAINNICKYSTYIVYPLHILILGLIK